MALDKDGIAKRIAQELHDGYYVNLGIGIPTLVANYIPEGMEVTLQSENGLLGIGPFPEAADVDPDLINAGKQTITAMPGAAFFDSSASFAMIRGGHIDVTVLGALQVSERGDLANWTFPERGLGNIGGAMDLAAGCNKVIVAMEHVTPKGQVKILKQCSYPLTAARCVKLIVTDIAVIHVTPNGLVITETAPGWTPEEVQALSEPKLLISPDLKEIEL